MRSRNCTKPRLDRGYLQVSPTSRIRRLGERELSEFRRGVQEVIDAKKIPPRLPKGV